MVPGTAVVLLLAAGLLPTLAGCGEPDGPEVRAENVTTGDGAPRAATTCVAEEVGGPAVPTWTPRTWTVRRGETLTSIALRAYGDAALWREIAAANPQSVRGESVAAGTVLVLPEPPR